MKKIMIILAAVMLFVTSGCGSAQNSAVSAESAVNKTEQATAENTKRVMLEIDGKNAVLILNNSPAAERLYNMLPLTLSFKDFNNTEKISYTEKSLNDGLKPEGHQPKAGDLCIYAPWGNLCLFYHDFRYTGDLFYLGHLESGVDLFAAQKSDFEVKLTKAAE